MADLNGDGKPDLAVTNRNGNAVSDLNGDGRPDVAFVNAMDTTSSVLLHDPCAP